MNTVIHFTAMFVALIVAYAWFTGYFGAGLIFTAMGWAFMGITGFFVASTIGAWFSDTVGDEE